MKKYDVVIIGGGLGGLTAGALLARRGQRVVVLEKHFVVGGYAQNFRRGEFTFDASLHAIGGLYSTGFAHTVKELQLTEQLTFLAQPSLFRAIFPDCDITLPSGEPDRAAHILTHAFPTERRGIDSFFALLRQVRREDRLMTGDWRYFAMALAPFVMPVSVASEFITVDFVLRLFFSDPILRAVLAQLWGYFGLPPDRLQAQYFLPPMAGYLLDGSFSIRGGSQQLSSLLAEIIQKANGEVHTRTEVVEILLEKGKAVGVKTAARQTFFGNKIISNLSPHVTYGKLLPACPSVTKALAHVSQLELSSSGTQVYLGLDAPIANIWPQLAHEHEIFWNATTDFTAMSAQASAPTPITKNLLGIGITLFSNVDSALCPEQRGTVGLSCADNLARWQQLSPEEYRAQKTAFEHLLIQTAENVLPGLTQHIMLAETGTPRTMARYTGNPGGALYGFAQTVSQGGFFKRFSCKSPVPNLVFASAWTFPGGGFEGTMRAGAEAARILS